VLTIDGFCSRYLTIISYGDKLRRPAKAPTCGAANGPGLFAETNVFDISRANSETIPAVKTPDKDRAKMPEDGLTRYPHLHRWLFLTFLIVATVVYNGPYHETGMVG
jgi:hypothetical protein